MKHWTQQPFIQSDEYAPSNERRLEDWKARKSDFTPPDPDEAVTKYENRRGE